MAHYFTPPTRTFAPTILPDGDDTDDQSPAMFFRPSIPVGVNVWLWTDNTVQEVQPPLTDARINADGTITPGYKKVWYGGHKYPITDSEYAILLAAGYSANLTSDAIFGTSTFGGDTYG